MAARQGIEMIIVATGPVAPTRRLTSPQSALDQTV